jgi:cytochrome P450
MNSALQPVGDILLSVMEDIRNRPREGVCSALIHSNSEEPCSWDEILMTMRHLWFAGTVTLTGLIPAAIRVLCESQELRGRLAREPERMPSFVSEMLRLEAPTQFVPRMALEEITVDGVTIPLRAMVRLGLASANRDPAAFPNPDVLDLDRPPHRHLSFGLGEHFCIGATIAKTIAATVLQRLINEFPALRREDSQAPLVFEQSPTFRALVSLPVLCAGVA